MKVILAFLTVILATQVSCMTGPRPVKSSPGDYLAANAPGRMWATLTDGERIIIDGPRVIADTVFGWADGVEEVAIPVADLTEIRVRQLSIVKSSIGPAMVLGGAVFAAVALKKDVTGTACDAICQGEDPSQAGGVELTRLPRP